MLNFFYDSLETLKKVRIPTKKEIRDFTLIILFVIFVSGLYFLIIDNVFGEIMKILYSIIRGG